MKKFIIFLGAIVFFSFIKNANAQTANPTKYSVDVVKIELCESSACANPFIIGDTNTSFDIASAGVGAEIGAYIQNINIPPREYNHIRVTLGRAFTVQGVVPAGGGLTFGNCGTAGAVNAASATTTGFANLAVGGVGGVDLVLHIPDPDLGGGRPTTAQYAAAGVTVDPANTTTFIWQDDLSSPIKMMEGKNPVFDIGFDVTNLLQAADAAPGTCNIWLGAPTIDMQMK